MSLVTFVTLPSYANDNEKYCLLPAYSRWWQQFPLTWKYIFTIWHHIPKPLFFSVKLILFYFWYSPSENLRNSPFLWHLENLYTNFPRKKIMCNISTVMQGSVSRSTTNMGNRFEIVLVCYKKILCWQRMPTSNRVFCYSNTNYFCFRELKFNHYI
jgi:hypothetical protein